MRHWQRLTISSLSLLGVLAGTGGDAKAIVVQINGQICPQGTNLVPGLNRGENGCPMGVGSATCYSVETTPPNNGPTKAGPQGAIDPVLEAGLDPQVFAVPKTGANFNSVEFVFLYRGSAGYRNSFGWYNVGDDLSNLANLHTVITCSPATDPPPNAPDDWDQVINFQTEFTANRYKGGFIGFFLVTPQDQSGSCSTPNCGRPDDPLCVGRIYYTERAINGDGNYVHYLVYQSKILDAALNRVPNYYFGFEDLYRGGDNDFKDVTMLVKGLVVPCSPQPEVCDGIDNNCDGIIDNNTSDTGPAATCSTGGNPLVGACKAGHYVCDNSSGNDVSIPGNIGDAGDKKVCVGEVLPTAEVCNGLDDNCNNMTDETPPGGWVNTPAGMNVCPPSASLGVCNGMVTCEGAQGLQCVDAVQPSPEVCNGLDDNCNGQIDESPSDVGTPCGTLPADWGVGICKPGKFVCENSTGGDTTQPGVVGDAGDKKVCVGEVTPEPEICDGLDNDCNGMIDDNVTGLSAMCTPKGVVSCGGGHEICVNGTKVCVGFTLPQPEKCNGLDDNCNGVLDDMPVDVGQPCGTMCAAKHGTGACAAGTTVCDDSTGKDITMGGKPDMGDHLGCVGEVCPTPEVCDGKDNDCDGSVDNAPSGMMLPGVGVACMTSCGNGTTVCKDGNIVCQGPNGGGVEYCNGKDDNCNGIIDDMPVDVGGACGSVFLNDAICQPAVCAAGKFECINSMGKDTSLPGDKGDSGDTRVCAGENKGDAETCNGIDDDCNGIVDDAVPGTGVDCVPNGPDGKPIAGLTVAMLKQGICSPGKVQCVSETTCTDADKVMCKNGKKVCPSALSCTGGTLPQPKICSKTNDNDCDGNIDLDGACPDPAQMCENGECSIPCKGGEFPCPGGQQCVGGFCIVKGGSGGSGGASAAGGSTGHAGTAGTSSNGGTSAGGTGNGVGGSAVGGSSSTTTGGSSGSSNGGAAANHQGGASNATGLGAGGEDDSHNVYGLATGGGGFSCSTSTAKSGSTFGALAIALAGVLARRRRRNRDASQKKAVRS